MISGTFHTTGQEWRYYSREKALIHTLHLAQLPSSHKGDTILIDSVSPSGNNGGFSVPPLQNPIGSGLGGGIENVTFYKNIMSDCFASVGPNQAILAQRNAIIQFGVWTDLLKEIIFTPQQPGRFMLHAEFTSGVRGYEPPAPGLGGSTAHAFRGRIQAFTNSSNPGNWNLGISQFTVSCSMAGFRVWPTDPTDSWSPSEFLTTMLSGGDTRIAFLEANLPVRIDMTNQTSPVNSEPNSYVCAWMFKFAET